MSRILRNIMIVMCLNCAAAALAQEGVHWSYAGATGPEHWATLCAEYGGCTGHNQSPVDLAEFVEADLPPLAIAYGPAGDEIVNNGHTVQVNCGPGSSLTVDGIRFDLKQFHFHAPSENTIAGRPFAMEAHFVHADDQGDLAVVSVMFETGAPNPALAALWGSLPMHAGDKAALSAPFPAADLLPADRDYYRFNGSLTTPPCTEGVRWLVMKKAVTVSAAQVEAFAGALEHPNNRPLQPRNARLILK